MIATETVTPQVQAMIDDEMIATETVTPQVQAMIDLAEAMLAALDKGGAAAAAAAYREPEQRAE